MTVKRKLKIASLYVVILIFSLSFLVVGFDTVFAFEQTDTLETNAFDIRIADEIPVKFGKVIKLQQVYDGIDVFGATKSVAVDNNGNILSESGEFVLFDEVVWGSKSIYDSIAVGNVQGERIFYPSGNKIIEAIKIETDYDGGTEYIISLSNGEVLLSTPVFNNFMTQVECKDNSGQSVKLDVDLSDDIYYLRDTNRNIYVYDAKNLNSYDGEAITSEDGNFTDTTAVTAYENIIKAYEYYADPNSVGTAIYGMDGKNPRVHLMVHFERKNFNNSQYVKMNNINYVCIGDGSSSIFAASDIVAHEYQHGVTNSIVNFIYDGESGSLSEGFSDIFGALIEGGDPADFNGTFWVMGSGSSQRSMIGGTRDQHYTYDEIYSYTRDIYTNCTIITHVQYVLCQKMPEFFTRQRIGTLWYTTLCMLQTNSTILDFGKQFLQAAINLNYDPLVVEAVSEALYDCKFPLEKIEYSSGKYHKVVFRMEDEQEETILGNYYLKDGSELSEGIDIKSLETKASKRASSERCDYKFVGWDVDLSQTVTKDLVITAKYEEVIHTYYVQFLDENGNRLSLETVRYGEAATPPDIVPPAGDKEYYYVLAGWSNDINYVTSNITVKPIFEKKKRVYKYSFYDHGEEYTSYEYNYGDKVTLPDFSDQKGFIGWFMDEDCTIPYNAEYVTGDCTLYAGWKSNTNTIIIIVSIVVAVILASVIVTVIICKRNKKARD